MQGEAGAAESRGNRQPHAVGILVDEVELHRLAGVQPWSVSSRLGPRSKGGRPAPRPPPQPAERRGGTSTRQRRALRHPRGAVEDGRHAARLLRVPEDVGPRYPEHGRGGGRRADPPAHDRLIEKKILFCFVKKINDTVLLFYFFFSHDDGEEEEVGAALLRQGGRGRGGGRGGKRG